MYSSVALPLLVLDLVDQSTNVGKKLNRELITALDVLLGLLSSTNTGWGTGQDNSTSGKGGTLAKEADQLGDVEDQVAVQTK